MNMSHKTAMARKAPSYMAKLVTKLSQPEACLKFCYQLNAQSVLDWGCGRGYDVAHYAAQGMEAAGYDPYWSPDVPTGKYDLVTCAYVLNVIADRNERTDTLKKAKRRLKRRGHILVCARSDKEINWEKRSEWVPEGDGFITKTGTFQVGLSVGALKSEVKRAGFDVILDAGDNYQKTVWVLGRKK